MPFDLVFLLPDIYPMQTFSLKYVKIYKQGCLQRGNNGHKDKRPSIEDQIHKCVNYIIEYSEPFFKWENILCALLHF